MAPNGSQNLAIPSVTSPDATAQEIVKGRVAALLDEANAMVKAGIAFME